MVLVCLARHSAVLLVQGILGKVQVTKASGARLEFGLALALVAVKVWKTSDCMIYHRMGGGVATVIIL